MKWSRRGARLRRTGAGAGTGTGAWSRVRRARFIGALLTPGGLEAACAAASATVAQALAERIRDRGFRDEWIAADGERIEAAETRLIDHLLAALQDGANGKPASLNEKATIAVWQALRDGRKRAAGVLPVAPVSAGSGGAPAHPQGEQRAVCDELEIAALIARVEAGIAEAEHELGLG
ncbi:MAG: hypothetical protein ACRC1J_04150 [Sandaracinobacteroides sp.]